VTKQGRAYFLRALDSFAESETKISLPVYDWYCEGARYKYLSEHCIPVSSADTRRHLRSANRHLLAVPRFRLNT